MSLMNSDTHFSASTGLRSALEKTSRFVKMGTWQMRLQKRFGKVENLKYKKNRLRLILGPHGSGADWLSRNLIQVERGMPYFNSPLTRIKPAMIEADGRWNLPFEYMKETFGKHPMEALFAQLVCLEDNDLLESTSNRIHAREANYEQVLVHEPYGLLMTEAVIRTFQSPTLLIVTDPVYCVDKAIFEQSAEVLQHYLQEDFEAVGSPAFLLRFMGSKTKAFRRVHQHIKDMPESAERTIYKQVLTLGAMNQMFLKLSVLYPKVDTLTLRDLVLTPNLIYQLGVIGGRKLDDNGYELAPKTNFRPDISSITAGMTGRPHRLQVDVADKAYRLLSEAGLREGRPMLSVGEKYSELRKPVRSAVA
jgi:hypothetical protein